MQDRKKFIRNFSIIAHIDHGKSTLADRLIEMTGVLSKREMENQVLDNMDIERERGITIKSQAVRMKYRAKDGNDYELNLIDTPGHVDFNYEVSRSLAACDGAVLVVDSSQGVEAQTLANVYLAIDNDLEILPVINKVDLPSANPEHVIQEIEDVIGLPADHAPRISAKSGLNVEDVLEMIVKEVPAPSGNINHPTQALIFDSFYDSYRGVVVFVRIKEGSIKVGDTIKFMATGATYEVTELGVRTPAEVKKDKLVCGEVGWISASIKSIQNVHVGDTITTLENESHDQLPGYRKLNPMVYCGLYPVDNSKYKNLREALEKIQLSDSSLVFEPETSQALGFGFRCGFLGLLHMDVIQERLEREFDLELIATAPSVIYKVFLTDKTMVEIDNPAMMPSPQVINYIEEPYVKASIMTPNEYIGSIMELCQSKRGEYVDIEIEDNITVEEFLKRINEELPKGVEFIKAKEISSSTPTLSSEIVYGEYLFNIDLPNPLSKELVKSKVLEFVKKDSIMITKKNKKGKLVENDIRPFIKTFDLVSLDDERATFETIIATGSKGNLNINILIPMLLEILGVEIDPREVETIRRDLYAMKDGELVTPL